MKRKQLGFMARYRGRPSKALEYFALVPVILAAAFFVYEIFK